MIHISDTINFEPTRIYQKPVDLKKLTLPVELLLLLLFLFCSACAGTPGQPSAMQSQERNAQNDSSNGSASASGASDINKAASCGRQAFPKYQDVENQKIVNSDIETGSAEVILHFHDLGQGTLDAFLARNTGVLAVDSQWPDWGAISLTVNESGLRQLSQDCEIRIIEANKRELPQ